MKTVHIAQPTNLDRIATWKEVRFAMRASSESAFKLARTDFLALDSDSIGCSCDLSEDIMWLAIVNEMPDMPSN
jgi:hypothetical protein